MARDAVAITTLTKNGAVNTSTGTVISTTNGAKIVAGGKTRKLLVRITNTITNATKVVTVKAGTNPPAAQAGVGDLSITVPASGDVLIALESARFAQTSGDINVDFATGMTGTIDAIRLPAGL